MKQTGGIQLKGLIIMVVLASLLTSITTGVIMYNNNQITSNISGNDLSQDEDLKDFLQVYASLVGDYYTDIDKTAMLEEAMKAMFDYLGEDYSNYLSEDETSALSEKLNGEYKGIGVQIINDNTIYRVFDESPAQEAGLLAGDRIVAINGEDVRDKSTSEVSSQIQSTSEETLEIGILRGEETLQFSVEIKTLLVPVTEAHVILQEANQIGYLAISTFSSTVAEQVRSDLEFLENQGIDSLILDLRGNTGGYLSGATEIAQMFLEKGKVIYSLVDKNETQKFEDDTDERRAYKIVILMNDSTASASEILAAALKDSYGATLVGEVSYGKGKVQQTKALNDGSMVKYTTAWWLRPNGECIDGVGLKPDEYVENWNVELEEAGDDQLERAIEVLTRE